MTSLRSAPVKHVPEWFPGAGFKRFARVACRKSDIAIDGPLEYVKELMKVSLPTCASKLNFEANLDHNVNESDASGNVSIAWSCFDRGQESVNPRFNENVIRGTTATMYMGEQSRGLIKR